MRHVLRPVLRVAIQAAVAYGAVFVLATVARGHYSAFSIRLGVSGGCQRTIDCERALEAVYQAPLGNILLEAASRSLILIAAIAMLTFFSGLALGSGIALIRRRTRPSLAIGLALGALAALPPFLLALGLQIGATEVGLMAGRAVLPVFGFGLGAHAVLPITALAIPTVATTAQLVGSRISEVLDAPFVTTAEAKGLPTRSILRFHVLPHVMPTALAASGAGTRVAISSLPIIEYLFLWNGIGYIALQAFASKDVAAMAAASGVIAAMLATAGLAGHMARPSAALRR